jgi:hypothetical protein
MLARLVGGRIVRICRSRARNISSFRPVVFYSLYLWWRMLAHSHLQQSTTDGNGNGVRTIVGAQLVYEILNMKINGGFCDR